jgi:hypothetical protein
MTLDHPHIHPTPRAELEDRRELSKDDLGTLQRAADLRRRFDAGIFPSTIGQWSHFRKLVRLGLLEFDDWGRDMDGGVERDVMIYKLTERGSEAVAVAERVRAAARSAAEAAQ